MHYYRHAPILSFEITAERGLMHCMSDSGSNYTRKLLNRSDSFVLVQFSDLYRSERIVSYTDKKRPNVAWAIKTAGRYNYSDFLGGLQSAVCICRIPPCECSWHEMTGHTWLWRNFIPQRFPLAESDKFANQTKIRCDNTGPCKIIVKWVFYSLH